MTETAPSTGTPVEATDLRRRTTQRRTLRVLVVAQVVGAIGTAVGPSVGVVLGDTVAGSEAASGLARTASTVGAALAGITLATLSLKFGRRPALVLGWTTAAVGAALLTVAAFASSLVLVITGMAMLGVGTSVGVQSAYTATDLADPVRRGRQLSLVVWAGTVGSVLGPNMGAPGAALAGAMGWPPLTGAFLIATVVLVVAAVVVLTLLRPDPLRLARELDRPRSGDRPALPRLREALPIIWRTPAARTAYISMICAHIAMIGVMTMTPVHLHRHGHSLTVVGLTISVHVAGMFAFAPLVGWCADRFGSRPVILTGQALFAAAAVNGFMAGDSAGGVTGALFLLGLAWSVVTVSGASLLSGAVDPHVRPLVQGTTDTSMNAAAAIGAGAAGLIAAGIGFNALALVAVVLVVPPIVVLAAGRGAPAGR
ncbi:MFS transporter [Nakamurella alba]|uniref:MFS transporter n=1 Tax=Nakamurella alba TaxID=2665158 RepID=UPI0018AA2807|nr:MFS transporter [Nakamurella alba]